MNQQRRTRGPTLSFPPVGVGLPSFTLSPWGEGRGEGANIAARPSASTLLPLTLLPLLVLSLSLLFPTSPAPAAPVPAAAGEIETPAQEPPPLAPAPLPTSAPPTPAPPTPAMPAPVPLARVARVLDTATGAELSIEALCERLATADAVFLGETHLDEVTHRVQWAIYERLVELRAGKVVLALEMFTRDAQPVLDAYLAGRIDESEFLGTAHPWGNYRAAYRPLIEHARARCLRVVASNLPRSIQRAVGMGGHAAYEALDETQRAWLPPDLQPNSDAYWERFARVVRGHGGMMMGGDDPQARLYSVQSLWDNVMGWSCAEALRAHPDHLVLHVNGGFHTLYRDGTARQFLARAPQARMLTVDIDATRDLARAGEHLDPSVADYVVAVESRARDVNDGALAVTVGRELRYRLHVPAGAGPWPLLVWLGEDGLHADESLETWRIALGGEVALAVVEHSYPQREEDLGPGGRWFQDESLDDDLGALHGGVFRIWEYLARYHRIDPERVVLAGAGSGATVVASIALYRSELPARCLALAPARYARLRDRALPDPTTPRARPGHDWLDLEVWTATGQTSAATWWETELAAYREVGLLVRHAVAANSELLAPAVERVRELFALPPRESPQIAADRPAIVLMASPGATSPRAHHWLERLALALSAQQRDVRVARPAELAELFEHWPPGQPLELRPMGFAAEHVGLTAPSGSEIDLQPPLAAPRFADARALPLAPGPFGGTTVVVVPAGTAPDEVEAWHELGRADVLKKRSRFARLVVAAQDTERDLAVVLEELRAAGKSNVLIVPAAFAASNDELRRLRAVATPFADAMQIHWLPGLGGQLHRLEGISR